MKSFPVIGSIVVLIIAIAGWYLVPRSTPRTDEALFYQSDFVSVPEGTLIRAAGDERVYYAIDGHKRWIDSAQTFTSQGFRAEEVQTVSASDLTRYPDGEPITIQSRIILPREQKVLPDLAPLAPYELRYSTVGGRTVIRFTGSFWNKGYRKFELLTENQLAAGTVGTEDVFQHVQAEDGTDRKKFVGTFEWHPAHNHHHYGDFAEYLFEPALLIPGTNSGVSSRQKTTFCIRDDERMPADIPNVSARSVYTTCGRDRQGVSAGWIDVYRYTLADQYVDVNDMPPGVYALSFRVDPNERFIEEHSDNNIATTLVRINVQQRILQVLAVLSPFQTERNFITDGTLIRDATTGAVYVVNHNRKRWIRSVDIFGSYGYDWNAVYPVTAPMADAIPYQQLIRRQGTQEVYLVNERGYYRHILNPDVFTSYGFRPEDIADINEFDFLSYAPGTMILLTGDAQVYAVEGMTKRPLGTIEELQGRGEDLSSLHLVNQTDFNSYTTL